MVTGTKRERERDRVQDEGHDPRLEVLLDGDGERACPLTPRLERAYGGPFALRSPCLYANFVSSVDGVVALGVDHPDAGGAISGHSRSDRFVMALLRACADAIIVGGGTLRATRGHRWTAEGIYPTAAADLAELRSRLGLDAHPRFVVVTASGDIDVEHPALELSSLVITGDPGAGVLRNRLPASTSLLSLGPSLELPGDALIAAVRAEGHRTLLTEGGPILIGHLVRSGVLDELFLTVSPILAGRSSRTVRPGLVDGVAFGEDEWPHLELRSARRDRDHLFLRYRLPGRSE